METIVFTGSGIVIGGLITFFVARFYHKQAEKTKSLSAFIQFVSAILSNIDPEVRRKLLVSYDSVSIDSMYQMQGVIANTGEIPIRDIIDPLTLNLPSGSKVLDVSIEHIEPNGRTVEYKIINSEERESISFTFPLLNSGEYFVFKILVKGEIQEPEDEEVENDDLVVSNDWSLYDQFEFLITADDLPPSLSAKPLPFHYEHEQSDNSIEWSALITAGTFGLLAFCLSYFLYSLNWMNEQLHIFNPSAFIQSFSFLHFSILISWLLNFALVIVAIILVFVGFGDLTTKKKKPKFLLPKKFRSQDSYFDHIN